MDTGRSPHPVAVADGIYACLNVYMHVWLNTIISDGMCYMSDGINACLVNVYVLTACVRVWRYGSMICAVALDYQGFNHVNNWLCAILSEYVLVFFAPVWWRNRFLQFHVQTGVWKQLAVANVIAMLTHALHLHCVHGALIGWGDFQ